MPVIAEAQVPTEDASRYLVQLCRHLSEKAQAHPDLPVRVEWSETTGTADFGWGRCTMQAGAGTLALRAEAADEDGLDQVQEFVTRHLEQHGADDQLTVTWRRPGLAAADPVDPGHRRETMRRFHRRVRHEN